MDIKCILLVFCWICLVSSIYVPEDNERNVMKHLGIKTIKWQPTNNTVQIHHNYSKIAVQTHGEPLPQKPVKINDQFEGQFQVTEDDQMLIEDNLGFGWNDQSPTDDFGQITIGQQEFDGFNQRQDSFEELFPTSNVQNSKLPPNIKVTTTTTFEQIENTSQGRQTPNQRVFITQPAYTPINRPRVDHQRIKNFPSQSVQSGYGTHTVGYGQPTQNINKNIQSVHNQPSNQHLHYKPIQTQQQSTQQLFPTHTTTNTVYQTSESVHRPVQQIHQTNVPAYGNQGQYKRVFINTQQQPAQNVPREPKRIIIRKAVEYKQPEAHTQCPSGATGQFVYELSCNQFLNCWKGRGIVQNCAPGTLFNPHTLECDYADKVECISGPRKANYETAPAKLTQAVCPSDFTGLIPHYTDCTKFIQCNHGQTFVMDCPPGTLFDTKSNNCDFPYKAQCVFSKESNNFGGSNKYGQGTTNQQIIRGHYIVREQHSINNQLSGFGTNNQNQQQFGYNQHHGNYDQQQLGLGQQQQHTNYNQQHTNYNQQQLGYGQQHYNQQQARQHTNGHTNGYNPQGSYTTTHQITTLTTDYCVGKTGLCEHPYDCAKYIRCENGLPKVFECDPGTNYNPVFKICDQKVQCQNKAYHQQTIDSQHYRPQYPVHSGTTTHQTQENVNWQANYCNGKSGLHEHPHDCAKYVRCVNGQVMVSSCGPGTLFHPIFKICDHQANVKCKTTDSIYQSGSNSNGYPTGATSNNGYQTGSISNVYHTGSTSNGYQTGTSNGANAHISNGYQTGSTSNGYQTGTSNGANTHISNGYQTGSNNGYLSGSNHHGSNGYYNQNNLQGSASTDHTTQTNNWQNNYCVGKNGLQEHPYDCAKYIRCTHGQLTILTCSQGKLYNPLFKICDQPISVDCKSRSVSGVTHPKTARESKQGEVKCPDYETGLLPHPYDCAKFLNCANGQTYVQDCGPGTVFNPKNKVCDFPYNVECGISSQSGSTVDEEYVTDEYPYQLSTSTHPTIVRPTQTVSSDTGYNQQQTHHQNQWNQHKNPGQNQGNNANTGGYYKPSSQSIYEQDQQHIGGTNNIHTGIYPNTNDQHMTGNPTNRPDHINPTVTEEKLQPSPSTNTYYVYNRTESLDPQSQTKPWPPPFPSTDTNADYVFEDYDEPIEVPIMENEKTDKSVCSKEDFKCGPSECISASMVCNKVKDCKNGIDEAKCEKYMEYFSLSPGNRLAIVEQKKLLNVTLATCAKYCFETKLFKCKSFNFRKMDGMCFLLTTNLGLSGGLIRMNNYDYFELKSESVDCGDKFMCNDKKCIDTSKVCDGNNDCVDRTDEKFCSTHKIGYQLKMNGSQNKNEGRLEVTVFGKTGYICDDQFGMRDADVACRELGYEMGAVEVKGNSYFAKDLMENNTLYLMDDLMCLGNETSLKECNFNGWGVSNCLDHEIVGIVCKTAQETCQKDYWKCNTGNECVPMTFVCDGVDDCKDKSDEASNTCEAPVDVRLVGGKSNNEGRVEIKYHNTWGTICDDDFNDDAAKVVCKSLGFLGKAKVVKDGQFGPGNGLIWLDQVFCKGNETSLESCSHWNWGEHNCEHTEDVGVICGLAEVPGSQRNINENVEDYNEIEDSDEDFEPPTPLEMYPERCGLTSDAIFEENSDVHFRVVKGTMARRGQYPWQASLRVKAKSKSHHWCGAVVISQKFVLTAAHCLTGFSKGSFSIVAGDYDVDEDEQTEQEVFIDETYIHENFRKDGKMNNDIALVKLKGRGFVLTGDVQAICLPSKDTPYTRNMNCTISGFGSTQTGKSTASHVLRAGWVPIQDNTICKMPHVYGDAITDGMFCAGSLDEGVDACDGDSGGPLACLHNGYYTLYGLTSWGQHCGYANKPGVYVKIAHYKDWIDSTIENHLN